MDDKPSALYPNVPTLKEAIGSDWTMAAWRGIVAPKGIPADVRDKLSAAVQKVAASKEYTDFMASRGFGVIYAGPEDFAQVHGQVGHRPRRDDEGRRPGEVASSRVKLNDAVFGAAAAGPGRRPCSGRDPGSSRRSRASRSGRRCFRA